jgi:hypothetical protein
MGRGGSVWKGAVGSLRGTRTGRSSMNGEERWWWARGRGPGGHGGACPSGCVCGWVCVVNTTSGVYVLKPTGGEGLGMRRGGWGRVVGHWAMLNLEGGGGAVKGAREKVFGDAKQLHVRGMHEKSALCNSRRRLRTQRQPQPRTGIVGNRKCRNNGIESFASTAAQFLLFWALGNSAHHQRIGDGLAVWCARDQGLGTFLPQFEPKIQCEL